MQTINTVLTPELLATIAFHVADRVFPFYRAVAPITDPDLLAMGAFKTAKARRQKGQEVMRVYRQSLRALRCFYSVCRTWALAVDGQWINVHGEMDQFRDFVRQGPFPSLVLLDEHLEEVKPPVPPVPPSMTTRWHALTCLFSAWFPGEGPNVKNVSDIIALAHLAPNPTSGKFRVGLQDRTLAEIKRNYKEDIRKDWVTINPKDELFYIGSLYNRDPGNNKYATSKEAKIAVRRALRLKSHWQELQDDIKREVAKRSSSPTGIQAKMMRY